MHGFYALINWGARQKIPEDAGDFRLLSPRAAAALRQLPERNRFFKGLASWIGFRQIRVDYEPAPRAHGVTTFSPGRLIGLSIEGLTSFSVAPLRFASLLGVLLAAGAFLFGLSILWETWTTGKSVPGYPSLVVGLMTIGGVQLIMIGIVGEYIGKILSELKARPIYFVAEHSVKRADAEPTADSRRTDRRRMNDAAPLRRIWLCADDYGISAGVNRAIRDLIERGRLNATSVMMVGPAIGRDEVAALQAVAAAESALRHRPARHADRAVPSADDAFPPDRWRHVPAASRNCCARGLLRRLDAEMIHAELRRRSRHSTEMFGRAPDFVDGHQHVQLFPQVRDAFLARGEGSGARRLGAPVRPPSAARQTARRPQGAAARHAQRAIPQDARRAPASRFNPAFAGAYDFTGEPDFGALMQRFLDGLPEGGARDVPSRLRRRHACRPRSADRPSASANTPFSPASISRRCWPRIKLHWLDIVARNAAGHFVAYRNLIRPRHYLRHKARLHLPRASRHSTRGRTP